LVLKGLGGVAIRIAENLSVAEVIGDALPFSVGDDVRDILPALCGMENELSLASPDIDLPFVNLCQDDVAPVSLKAVRDEGSKDVWIILRDVSEDSVLRQTLMQQRNALALAQDELMRARDTALAANQTKTVFLANVSHELRTPLQVVIGGASILLKNDEKNLPSGQIVEFATDIHESGLLLLELVDDLIDLSRAETGDLTLYEEWFSFREIATLVVSLARGLPMVGQSEIRLKVNPDVPTFYGDPRRCKQIMLNLLSNALKAVAPKGVIEMSVQIEDGSIVLEVRDDGPGMTSEACSVALQPFGQPNAELRSKGSGLGLPIVKRLAELHDGTMTVITAPGEGLTARVAFPPSRTVD